MIQTTDFVDVDEHIGIQLEPDAIHIMRKSEYSDLYGDYSSFSNELDGGSPRPRRRTTNEQNPHPGPAAVSCGRSIFP